MTELPKSTEQLVSAIITAGWSFSVVHGKDSGDAPFVTVEAVHPWDRDVKRLHISWHTRATGTYRLFSCLMGGGNAARDITLAKAFEHLEANHAE